LAEAVPENLVALAERLADAAGEIVRRYFRTPVAVDAKPDLTPVTIADREAERAMRALIAVHAPGHGIIGEEEGRANADAEHVWCLDPIDGTKAFITGKPMFGTLVSLVRRGMPVLGIIDQPVSRERWLGVAGRKTTFNGAPCTTRKCPRLADALLNATTPDMFVGADAAPFARLAGQVRHALYGGDCYAYGLLASGHLDLVVETQLKPWDFCALAPIVAGAGGRMVDWQGGELALGSDGRVIAAGDPTLITPSIQALRA
jgi:histidinol phosphatase-like enzyme (inositol monophosphatase family)